MRGVFRRLLTMEHVKDYVSIGAGLAAIVGSLVTAGALFLGSGGGSSTAAPTATISANVAAASPTLAPPTETPSPPTATPSPTPTPAPSGEFLRAQFGTQQDPVTLLPTGTTVGPDEDLEACAGDTLYAWVEHTFDTGDVIDGRLSSRAGTLYSDSVVADARAPNFWISARVSDTGIHTLTVSLEGGEQRAEWSVEVRC
jgi:hypothetical protein